jgi:hypothetical protein
MPERAVSDDLFPVHVQPRTPDLTTFQPRPSHACPNSFDDDAPLKLSDGTHYDEDRPAKRSLRR